MSSKIPRTEMFSDDFSARLDRTPHGMAYLMGSGPVGETCRTCENFIENGRYHGEVVVEQIRRRLEEHKRIVD